MTKYCVRLFFVCFDHTLYYFSVKKLFYFCLLWLYLRVGNTKLKNLLPPIFIYLPQNLFAL